MISRVHERTTNLSAYHNYHCTTITTDTRSYKVIAIGGRCLVLVAFPRLILIQPRSAHPCPFRRTGRPIKRGRVRHQRQKFPSCESVRAVVIKCELRCVREQFYAELYDTYGNTSRKELVDLLQSTARKVRHEKVGEQKRCNGDSRIDVTNFALESPILSVLRKAPRQSS